MTTRIPLAEPDLRGNEAANVAKAIESTWISSNGEFLTEFERQFGAACGVDHALAVTNGTVALHLALLALGIGPGDEVIVPSMTYIATANAVSYVGALPVFADVDPATWCLDPTSVAAAVTPQTKAVIAVHLYGHPAPMRELREVCEQHGLRLVEDAAEAPFATAYGQPTGSFGDIATFSFYGNKVITSGEGGACTTKDAELAARMRLIRGQGMDPERRYFFTVVGHNFRMTNVAAAMLCAQLERVDEMVAHRRQVWSNYDDAFRGVAGLRLQQRAPWATATPWLYSLLVEGPATRDDVVASLEESAIETRPFFIPIHELPPYIDTAGVGRVPLPVTEDLGRCGLSLPTSSVIPAESVEAVIQAVLAAVSD